MLKHGDGTETTVGAGKSILLKAGERVKWTWPGPCKYVPICIPGFTPDNCHREADEAAVKDAAAMVGRCELVPSLKAPGFKTST